MARPFPYCFRSESWFIPNVACSPVENTPHSFYCLAQHNGLSAQGGAPPAHGLSHASAQEKACRLWCFGSIEKKLSRASRTTVLSSAFFAQVQKRTRDTRLDNKAGDIMAKENFTL